jgi:hypothetical protein
MKWFRSVVIAAVALLPANAGTVNISGKTTQEILSGDVISFLISDSSFGFHAANMGIPSAPTYLSVNFASMPSDIGGQFSAELESTDGSISVAFPQPMNWQPGIFGGSQYRGPVSTLTGPLRLQESLAQQIFSDSLAILVLSYTGPDEIIGLAGYTLPEDLTVSLFGGSLNVGSQIEGAMLQTSGTRTLRGTDATAPEPHSGVILLGGGALLCAIAKLLNRLTQRNI